MERIDLAHKTQLPNKQIIYVFSSANSYTDADTDAQNIEENTLPGSEVLESIELTPEITTILYEQGITWN